MTDVSDYKFWDQCYKDNNIGWDLGRVTPVFKKWSDNLKKKSKILVPGAGNGYDPLYFSNSGHDVTAVDFSNTAVKHMKKRAKKNKVSLNIIEYNYFNLLNLYRNEFDYIIEYTFFCAIDPLNRSKYIDVSHKLLKDNGTLIGLFLPLNKQTSDGGPPFAVREKEIEAIFSKKFDMIDSCYHSLSIEARKANEKYYEFKKK